MRRRSVWLFLLGIWLVAARPLRAQSAPPVQVFGTTAAFDSISAAQITSIGQEKRETAPRKHGEFAAAPIPVINPTLGNGLGGAVLYAVPLGRDAPPSTFGVAGFGTSNGSWLAGGGFKLNLFADRFRLMAGGGAGHINYDFFGVGNAAGVPIPLSMRSRAFLIEPLARVTGKWYLGLRYHIIRTHAGLDLDKLKEQYADQGGQIPDPLPVNLPDADLNLTTAALGLRAEQDSRDTIFYPRSGSLVELNADFFRPAFGADRSYNNYTAEYNRYFGFRQKNVVAVHGAVCSVTANAPFFDVCQLGASKDLRGYPMGKYQDHRMLVAQAEYRRDLFWRLGAAAFIGAGEVAATFGDFTTSGILPGGGAGLRLVLARQNHISLRADYALGKHSHAFYVGIAEAF